MNKDKIGMICSTLLETYPKINHGFGTKYENQELHNVITPHQVHGNKVAWIDGQVSCQADGLITNKTGVAIGVRTADCVPILLYEPVKRIVAVVHAGWKGIAMNIVSKAVGVIESRGGKRQKIIAAIGPHIGPCCYRVDRVRLDKIKKIMNVDDLIIHKRNDDTYLDLGEMNKQQLMLAGVGKKHIDMISDCTFHRADLFYSHRRDGRARNNRHMINFIKLT